MENKILKGKDLVDYIVKNNLQDKDIMALINFNKSIQAHKVIKIEFSNNEDDSIFLETEHIDIII